MSDRKKTTDRDYEPKIIFHCKSIDHLGPGPYLIYGTLPGEERPRLIIYNSTGTSLNGPGCQTAHYSTIKYEK